MRNASLSASPKHDTCAGTKSRTGAATESLIGGGATRIGFASRSSRVGSALLWLGAEGPELPQQSLCATLHGLGSGSSTLTTHWLQQAVEVDTGIAKVDVGEDPRQRCRRQNTRLGLGRGAKAKGDIFKSVNQEGNSLAGPSSVAASGLSRPLS